MPLFQSESNCETILIKMTFDLHENETACRTHFHMKGFALRLVLKQRHKRKLGRALRSKMKSEKVEKSRGRLQVEWLIFFPLAIK